jgi:hypothetical protein
VLRGLEAAYAALGEREAHVARAAAAAGLPTVVAADDVSHLAADGGRDGRGDGAPPAALLTRRDELLADLHAALAAARARRTAPAAARENIRVQLLRIGAGVGAPDDLAGDLAAARALLQTTDERPQDLANAPPVGAGGSRSG